MLSRMRRRRARLGATAAAALWIASVQAQSIPALPELAIDHFPVAARAAISRANSEAVAKPTDAAAVGSLGRALHAWELWDAAQQAYQRAQALSPRTFEWQYLDGVVLQRLGRYKEAAERLKAALALSPDSLPTRVRIGDALFDAREIADAKAVYAELVKIPASEPMGHFGLGRVAAIEGRHDAAIEHLERALAFVPEWGAANYALAGAYRAVGRREDAKRALERHQQYGPRWPTVKDEILEAVASLRDDARALLYRGLKLMEQGDLQGAIAAHEAAVERDPSLAEAHANLISLQGRAGNWAKAEEHYRAVVQMKLFLDDAHYDYGVILGLQQKWDGAAEEYRQALQVNPRHARAHNNLGQVLERTRKFDEALDHYRQAVDSQPNFRLARFNVGRALIALDKPREAIAELEKIVEPRDAESPQYVFALAVAYVRAGDKESGIRWATEAKRRATEHNQRELAAAIERELDRLK